jgi:uracil-DNA glycosylase
MLLTQNMAAANLDWLVMAGIDTVVESDPRRWLAERVAAPRLPATDVPSLADPARRPAVGAAAGPSVGAAVGVAPASGELAAIADLSALLARLAEFDHPLRRPDLPARLIDGDIAAGIIVLADQPDAEDSPVARLTARMLAAIGNPAHARAHLLPWPTPAGRALRDAEVAAFAPWLARAVDLARPRLLLAFGDRAAALAGVDGNSNRLRGRWLALKLPGGDVPMLATLHPRSLLGQPELKRLAWADLQSFAERLAI